MNNRALTLSLVMAIVAIFFVQSYVSSIEEETKKRFGTEILVVKAKKDIKEAQTIDETMLEQKLIPKRFLEPAAISFDKSLEEKEAIKSMRALVGTVAIVPIKKGEQVTFNKISELNIRTGLSPQVTPGHRAVSINVNETTGVGKLVKPGDRVDVIAVIDRGGSKENKIAKTVLQDVIVLAVGRNITNNVARTIEADTYGGKEKIRSLAEDFSFSSVTLEVEPPQAQLLALLMANGENALTLSLRNNDDTERFSLGSFMLDDVLGQDWNRIQRSPSSNRR